MQNQVMKRWQMSSNKWIFHLLLIINWLANSLDTNYSSTRRKVRKETKEWITLNTKKWFTCINKRSKEDGIKGPKSKTNIYSQESIIHPKILSKMKTKHWRANCIKVSKFKNKKFLHNMLQNYWINSLNNQNTLKKYNKICK